MFDSKWILSAVVTIASATYGETLLSYDFNGDNPWPAAATDVKPDTPLPVEPTIAMKPVGTIDVAHTDVASGAMLLEAEVADAKGEWRALFSSGLLAVKNTETNLGKLTLAFDLSVSFNRPVVVRFESYDASRQLTGGLEATIYPPAPDFYQRSALDLSTMKPAGPGKFNPADPFVCLVVEIAGPAWPSEQTHVVRLDNLHYASPAYYISPSGSDDNDGRTEEKPFLHPQKAIDQAKPGDIILLMGGDYRRGGGNNEQNGIIHFEGAGTPAAWITVKNYPGQKPTLHNEDCWNTIRVGGRVRVESLKDSPIGYFEIRGLHIRGGADRVMDKYRNEIGLPKASTNGNGIGGGSVRGGVASHHLRVADCVVEYCPGGGIGFGDSDWVTLENNVSRNNCWFTIYATSGFGTIGTANFDTTNNVYKVLIRNNKSVWNRCYIAWKQIGKLSDGNGIIVDSIYDPAKQKAYIGRTLIQNNLVTDNGGSGIHCFKAHQVDIVNNTAFRNAATPELAWGQIFLQRTNDARVLNNILYARDGQPVNTVTKDVSDKGNTNITRANNVYFGGGFAPIMGTDDTVGEPEFVDPWAHPDAADYRVKPSSPAIGKGKWDVMVPLTDIEGRLRPLSRSPDAGAYQREP